MESENIEFSFSTENLKGIPFDKYEKDFTFIVNGKQYQTSRFFADLLSPTIRELHYSDPTINEFYFNTQNTSESETENGFDKFLEDINFEHKNITKQQQKSYCEYFFQLGNIDEYFRNRQELFQEINQENVIERLQEINKIVDKFGTRIQTQYLTSNIDEVIKFISSNFENISKKEMKTLPISLIEKIINNEALKLQDEDSLMNFVIEIYSQDRASSILFEHVIFKNVSQETLKKFIDIFDLEDIDGRIWRSICIRLGQTVSSSSEGIESENQTRYTSVNKEKEDQSSVKEFKYSKENPFDGIMRHLTRTTGGNIHDNGTIEITSNSINGSCHPKNLVDYETENDYDSLDNGGAIVCFDFKDKLVQLTDYSMKSCGNRANGCHLKNWSLEVSKDGQEWEEVDHHENDSTLNGPRIVASFQTKSMNDFYRFVRLRQTGNSWYSSGNHNRFYFYFIEFYGKLKSPPENSQ